MKSSVIIFEHGDILIFSNITEACSYLEPVDVENNEYIAYDATGNIIDLFVRKDSKKILGIPVKLRRVHARHGSVNDAKGLAEKIEKFIETTHTSKNYKNHELEEVLFQLKNR